MTAQSLYLTNLPQRRSLYTGIPSPENLLTNVICILQKQSEANEVLEFDLIGDRSPLHFGFPT